MRVKQSGGDRSKSQWEEFKCFLFFISRWQSLPKVKGHWNFDFSLIHFFSMVLFQWTAGPCCCRTEWWVKQMHCLLLQVPAAAETSSLEHHRHSWWVFWAHLVARLWPERRGFISWFMFHNEGLKTGEKPAGERGTKDKSSLSFSAELLHSAPDTCSTQNPFLHSFIIHTCPILSKIMGGGIGEKVFSSSLHPKDSLTLTSNHKKPWNGFLDNESQEENSETTRIQTRNIFASVVL